MKTCACGCGQPVIKNTKKRPDHADKMRIRFSGEDNPMRGKTHSEETKKRISLALTGRTRIFSDEWKTNISKAKKGILLSSSSRDPKTGRFIKNKE